MSLCGLLQVKIRFADTQRQPGEKTRLIIKAAQGSKVAITAVDRSVHLLEEGNELSEADVSLYWMKAAIVKELEPQLLIAQNTHVKCIQLILVYLPIVTRLTAKSRPTVGQQSANRWPTVCWLTFTNNRILIHKSSCYLILIWHHCHVAKLAIITLANG